MHIKLGKEALILGEKFTYPTANCATDMNYHLSHVHPTILCKTYLACYCTEIQNYGIGL